MASNQFLHRLGKTLFNRDSADPSLGLRGIGPMVVAPIIITNATWKQDDSISWLIVIATPVLFAIAAVLINTAWQRSKTRPNDE